MTHLKRLPNSDDMFITVDCPLSPAEIADRETDYPILTPKRFARRYRYSTFKPVRINLRGKEHRDSV